MNRMERVRAAMSSTQWMCFPIVATPNAIHAACPNRRDAMCDVFELKSSGSGRQLAVFRRDSMPPVVNPFFANLHEFHLYARLP